MKCRDGIAANSEGIKDINWMLKRFGCPAPIEMVRIKYLNNLVEQDSLTARLSDRKRAACLRALYQVIRNRLKQCLQNINCWSRVQRPDSPQRPHPKPSTGLSPIRP
jgi:transposase-like protein